MKSMRSKLMFMASLLVIALLVVGCGSNKDEGSSNEEGTPTSDVEQEARVATPTEALGLSPVETWDGASAFVNVQMYEGLFDRDPETGEIIPLLAESYENPDDLTWVFKLKEGVKFHDGTPFNAEAVKYTFEKLVDPETAAPGAHVMAFMDKVEVEDEYTVKLTTHEPSPNVLPVLSSDAVGIISPEADQNQNLMQEPVGTGPFKFESWVQGDRIILVKNEDYWGEPAKLDKLTYITVPDASTAVSMLEAGEVELLELNDPSLLPRVKAMDGADLLEVPDSAGYFFSFNMEKEPMNELEFRKAVAMAIDVEGFIDTLDGVGFDSAGMFGPAVIDYDESIEDSGYNYDPEAAKKIIEENGYGDYELTIFSTDQGGYKRQAEIAHANLTEVGLNVKMEQMEFGTLLESASNGEHDMFVLASSNSMTGLETLYGYFHSDSIGANNRTHSNVEEFDKLVDEARITIDDEKRQELINEAHEMLVNDAFIVSMYHGVHILAHSSSLKDVTLIPTVSPQLKKAYME